MARVAVGAAGDREVASRAPWGVILLCAGRGTRMHPLTRDMPKCLLPVDDRLVVDHLLDAILARTQGEVVVVTGFAADRVRDHLRQRHPGRIEIAHNDRFDGDVNILSVETGVAALRHPQRGYLVVETDLLLEPRAWDRVFAAMSGGESFWACHGRYHRALTGGIVHADPSGRIDAVEYQPIYDVRFESWHKMVGLLGVGPGQVAADRALRQAAIAESIAQYYLIPWTRHLRELPCSVVQLDGCFARSFNTVEDFMDASDRFRSVLASDHPTPHS